MEWTTVLIWIVAVLLVGVGIAGTALPALPGAPMVFGGLLLLAWSDDFARVGGGTIAALAVMTVLTYAVDFVASALGAKRVGASRRALVGAILGGVVGLFFGLPGVILGPFIGAVLGEYSVQRNLSQAGRVGFGAWLGMVLGMAAKLTLVFAMLGSFVLVWLSG